MAVLILQGADHLAQHVDGVGYRTAVYARVEVDVRAYHFYL